MRYTLNLDWDAVFPLLLAVLEEDRRVSVNALARSLGTGPQDSRRAAGCAVWRG